VVTFIGRGLYPGRIEGEALVAEASVPGWDAFDVKTGKILEVGNPLCGISVTGRILVLNGSRGSTGWGTQFLKVRAAGSGPAGLLFRRIDSRCAAAIVVSKVPAVGDFAVDLCAVIKTGDHLIVDGDSGRVDIVKNAK